MVSEELLSNKVEHKLSSHLLQLYVLSLPDLFRYQNNFHIIFINIVKPENENNMLHSMMIIITKK